MSVTMPSLSLLAAPITLRKKARRYSVDSNQDIMTKLPLKDYQNAKKLSTDVLVGR